jgi:nucleotide-binding universal stress UspA family protein
MTNVETEQSANEPATGASNTFLTQQGVAADVRHANPRGGEATNAAASVLSFYAAEESATQAILAAVKPGDQGGGVLRMAQWLAEHERRELHVISVVDSTPLISAVAAGVPVIPPFHDEVSRRAIKQELREAYERSGHTASRFRVDVLEGPAAATIADIAREHEVRMVVVGKGTHGLLSHLVYGEQVWQIIQASRSPVLVVPPDAPVPIERAMVAFDFSTASIRAAVTAHEMLGAGGRLTLVHVATPRRVTGKRGDWWLRAIERRTRATLGEFARALSSRGGVTVEMEKLHGDPVEVLSAYAQSQKMQLLACGWHEHALLERLFRESHTTELLHRAQCAVLVAPDPGGGETRDGAA